MPSFLIQDLIPIERRLREDDVSISKKGLLEPPTLGAVAMLRKKITPRHVREILKLVSVLGLIVYDETFQDNAGLGVNCAAHLA